LQEGMDSDLEWLYCPGPGVVDGRLV